MNESKKLSLGFASFAKKVSPIRSTLVVGLVLAAATVASAGTPLSTTANDFLLPGTQPGTLTDPIATPTNCTGCHSNYGAPQIEPYNTWQGSMLAQAGRDPITYAAMSIANQDVPFSGELCIRCHMPKGWLEGRSSPADASATTADDRQGVQCNVCHRLVDPTNAPGAPAGDAAIIAALADPVLSPGGAQMIVDPDDSSRGSFDVVGDLGYDPHLPTRVTLESPFHATSEMCGTCHDVPNTLYQRNMAGDYELAPYNTPGDPALGFPEQQTYSEWSESEYASTGVYAPQFAGAGNGIEGDYTVSTCQDCHMPGVTGRGASGGPIRPDMPKHDLVGANTLVPGMIIAHPVYGAEVNPTLLLEGADRALGMLRRSATISGSIDAGVLTVRVTNESGHKLPTAYPDGRRMWLFVKAFDADGAEVLESGSYVEADGELVGYEADPMDLDYDPNLYVWETHQGISADVALISGQVAGPGFHLALNNVRESDNRIPPRGFTNAAYEAKFMEPIGKSYADGQHWDDVTYPVGPNAVRAEVILYYQTTTKEYVEFLRDENFTDTTGDTLYTLWEDAGKGPPVEVAKLTVDTDAKVLGNCRKNVDKLQSKYFKTYQKRWEKCFASTAAAEACDVGEVTSKVSDAEAKLRERLGGAKDKKCAGKGLTPSSIGLGSYCPAPCSTITLFDLDDVAECTICVAEHLSNETLSASYGTTPPTTPDAVPFGAAADCQKEVGKASGKLATKWASILMKCESDNSRGKNVPELDCATDPSGKIGKAKTSEQSSVNKCTDYTGIEGCAATAANNAALSQCLEDSMDAPVTIFPAVAYP